MAIGDIIDIVMIMNDVRGYAWVLWRAQYKVYAPEKIP